MYAIKKNINKVLAAFLCACLLLSYNPAFGAVDAAWAAAEDPAQPTLSGAPYAPEGSNTNVGSVTTDNSVDPGGETPSTIIQASTYTSELQVQMTDGPLFGTKQEIVDYGKTHTGGYQIQVQATCSESNSPQDYEFEWEVYANGTLLEGQDYQTALANAFIKTGGSPTAWSNNVASQALNLSYLFNANGSGSLFTDSTEYTFKCTVKTAGKEESSSVVLYTLDSNKEPVYEDDKEIADDNLPPVIAKPGENGGILDGTEIKTELGDPQDDDVKGNVNKWIDDNEKDGDTDDDGIRYFPGDEPGSYNVTLTPDLEIDPGDGSDPIIVPAYEGDIELLFPLDKDWVKSDDNPYGYEDGDVIDVLWSVKEDGSDPQLVKTEVVVVKVDTDGDGIPDTDWPYAKLTVNADDDKKIICEGGGESGTKAEELKKNAETMPGIFTVLYTNQHTDPGSDENWYYTVQTVNTTNQHGEVLTRGDQISARFYGNELKAGTKGFVTITPTLVGSTVYKLKTLWFQSSPTAPKTVIYGDGATTVEGLTLDAALSRVTIGDALESPFAVYTFSAEFATVPASEQPTYGQSENDNGWVSLTMSVADNDNFVSDPSKFVASDNAAITATYKTVNDQTKQVVDGTADTGSSNPNTVKVLKNGKVDLKFIAHAFIQPFGSSQTGYYQVQSVWTRATDSDPWMQGNLGDFAMSIPKIETNLQVRIVVGLVQNQPAANQTFYRVSVQTDGTSGCSVDPTSGIVAVSTLSGQVPMYIQMTGVEGQSGYYPASVNIVENGVSRQVDINESKAWNYAWQYVPPKNLAGDVTITVNFEPVSGIRYGLEISNTVNGSIELLGKTPSSTGYAADENLPLLVTPADGYTVDKIEATITKTDGTTETKNLTSFWQAGVVNFQMPNGDTVVTATFKTKTTTLPPSGDPNETYALGVYVAGSELADPGYSMNSVNASDVIVGDGTVMANRNISMSGFSQANGNVNGSKGFTAAVKYGSDFVLNLDPSTNPQSVVAKVLLVEYSLNGTTKTPTRYKLYHQSLPVFNVMNITQNTDVYVYFTPVTPGQTVPTYEYVTVTTSITGKGTTPQLGPVKVVKGSTLPITIEPQTGSEWSSLKWQATGSNEVDLTGTVTAESAKTQPYTLNLTKINKDTVVTAVFATNGIVPDPDTYNVYAKSADGTAIAAGHTVAAVVNGTTQTLTTSGYPINKESNFDVTVTPKSGSTLQNLKFTWDDSNVKAFYNASTATLLFAKGTTSTPSGYTPYDPAQDSLGAVLSQKSTWHVNNLVCDLTVVPTFVTSGGPNPPNPPVPSDDDYYTVTTHIGSGLGQITTDNADKSNPLKIAKPAAGANPQQLQVSFTGAKGADGTQYVVESVTIQRSSDNGWLNFWEWITGNKTAQQYEQEAINNGWVNLPINANYDITVNFKTEGAAPGYVEKDNWAAVNVTSNSLKGSVSPQGTPAALVPKSGDASYKQFIVSPQKDSNDKFYAVKTVTVNWKNAQGVDQGPLVVNAGTADANQVITWDTTFNNVFTLHVDKLGLTQENMYAVNVEVDYSDSGELGNGSVVGEDPNTLMKTVNVSVYVNGVSVGGTSNTGGTVAPRDTFTMIQNQTVKTYPYGYTSTPIVVAPAQGYEVTRITKDGVANAAYLQSVLSKGYFDVTSQGPENTAATENIIIYLTQKPLGDRSFTVFAMLDPNGSQKGAVAPNILVSLDKDQDYFFCTQPTDYYIGVTKITDQYWTGSDWADVPAGTPNSCSWTRTEMNGTGIYSGPEYATGVFPGFTVKAVTVNGKIPNRRVLVTFGDLSDYPGNKKPNNDYTTENNDRASIKVNVWGDGRSALIQGLTPQGSLKGIYKSDNAKYSWSYSLPADSADGGYRVFCIEKNGTVSQGKRTGYTKRDLSQEGTVTFTKADLTRNGYDNTLDIYVRWFTTDQLNGGAASEGPGITGWGDDNGYVTSRSANGGAVSSSKASYGAAAPAAVDVTDRISTAALDGDELDTPGFDQDQTTTPTTPGSPTVTPGDIGGSTELPDPGMNDNSGLGGGDFVPVDFYMVPAENYMVDQVYLYNCKVTEYEVLAPKDVPVPANGTPDNRDRRVALKYRLELTDTSKPGYLFATYTKDDGSDQVQKWTQDYVDGQQNNNTLDYTMSVAVSPKSAVEALVSDTSQIHGKIITVTNGDPMVALQPTTAANGDAYEVTFDTVKIDPATATFSAEVGPLIKWNAANNELSTIYAIDEEALAAKGYSVEPVKTGTQKQLTYGASENELNELADDNTVIPAAADNSKPDYYTKYTVSGPVNASDLNGKNLKVTIPLQKISLADGNFPEYTQNTTSPNPNATYQLSARVDGEGGTITPTSTTVAGAWNGGDNIGPWTVASGTYVAFKVEANEGYLLDSLTLNGTINCLPRYFNQSTSTLLFPMNLDSDVVAKFVSRNSAEAMRTVTISVQGGHGTTSPAPGEHKVEKGATYAVTFVPDNGYVPYRIWVDGVESFVSPTLAGWSLPAAWSDQTFAVEYQPSGTTPSGLNYLVQTGQNAANDVAAGLVKTGDNPVAIACIVGVAALAAVGVWQVRRRKATAARAAKYSVTKRK